MLLFPDIATARCFRMVSGTDFEFTGFGLGKEDFID